jgi:hypothetical protein
MNRLPRANAKFPTTHKRIPSHMNASNKTIPAVFILILTGLSSLEGAVIYSDTVENNGTWTTIFGGFYATGNGLTPTAGSNYLAATTNDQQQRGFYDTNLGTHTVGAGTYIVTFDIGITNSFAFANRVTPIIGLTGNLSSSGNINNDNGARLLNTLDGSNVSLVSSTTFPTTVDFETWTLTYTVASGASVIGQDLGFWAKFYTGDSPNAAKGYAFDNFSVDFTAIPETSSALLGGLGMLCLLRRRR